MDKIQSRQRWKRSRQKAKKEIHNEYFNVNYGLFVGCKFYRARDKLYLATIDEITAVVSAGGRNLL